MFARWNLDLVNLALSNNILIQWGKNFDLIRLVERIRSYAWRHSRPFVGDKLLNHMHNRGM